MFTAVDLCADEQEPNIIIDHSNNDARCSDLATQSWIQGRANKNLSLRTLCCMARGPSLNNTSP